LDGTPSCSTAALSDPKLPAESTLPGALSTMERVALCVDAGPDSAGERPSSASEMHEDDGTCCIEWVRRWLREGAAMPCARCDAVVFVIIAAWNPCCCCCCCANVFVFGVGSGVRTLGDGWCSCVCELDLDTTDEENPDGAKDGLDEAAWDDIADVP